MVYVNEGIKRDRREELRKELRKTIRFGLMWLAIVGFSFAASVVLSGCQSYQPPGEGIWRAL